MIGKTTELSAVGVVPAVTAVRLEIRTRWKRPNRIPAPFIANTLRGALGITLRRLVCPDGWLDHDCSPCPLYQDCTYGQVFMPSPPADGDRLRRQQDLPRPFVIEPPGLNPSDQPGDQGLTFRLMLFGTAVDRLPYFVTTLDRLGHEGMGRDRVPFHIEQIRSRHPDGDEVLFTGGSNAVALPRRVITTHDILTTPWPVERLRQPHLATHDARPLLKLKFQTPLLLKSGSRMTESGQRIPAQEIRERPELGVIVRRLRDRLSSLASFFAEPWDHPDFAGLGKLSDRVNMVESQTQWLTRHRRSTRTGDRHQISGLTGHAYYRFPDQATFAQLAPLIRIGELIHVGKHAPWGNGGIQGVLMEERR